MKEDICNFVVNIVTADGILPLGTVQCCYDAVQHNMIHCVVPL